MSKVKNAALHRLAFLAPATTLEARQLLASGRPVHRTKIRGVDMIGWGKDFISRDQNVGVMLGMAMADLTFAELAVAKEAIGRTLGTMLHGRIKYPKEYDDGDPIGEAAPEATPPGPKAPAESYPDGVTVDAPQANL